MGGRCARESPRFAKFDDFIDFLRQDPSTFDSTDMMHLGSMELEKGEVEEDLRG
jgi:hypothetical protein